MNETDASEVVEDVLAVELDDQLAICADASSTSVVERAALLVQRRFERCRRRCALWLRSGGPRQHRFAGLQKQQS